LSILFPEDYLGSYPSVINAIECLQHCHKSVDIIGLEWETDFPTPPKFNSNVRFFLKSNTGKIDRTYELQHERKQSNDFVSSHQNSYFKKIIPTFIKFNLRRVLSIISENIFTLKSQFRQINYFLGFLFHSYSETRKNKYTTIIAIDSLSLLVVYLQRKLLGQNFHIYFWSLEISSYNNTQFFDIICHYIEKKALKNADFIISQCEKRAKSFFRYTGVKFNSSNFFELPHSRNRSKLTTRMHYFNEKFKINESGSIILHLGWIHDVMNSFDLSKSTLIWPVEYSLVLHERMKRSKSEPYIRKILNLNSPSLSLSINPVDYNKLDNLIASSDIGLVIYKPLGYGISWENMTKASGKIADYLALGKPVICSDLPGFNSLLETYQCGYIFKSLDDIPSIIQKILLNYETLSRNALLCFTKEYEFSNFFLKVKKSILENQSYGRTY
jgi:glycosyltransferase involved in cell wall biosynthesis